MDALAPAKLNLLRQGVVIPAVPLALDRERRFDPRRQTALMRYYVEAGAGGVAVGMHFTQFEIRNPGVNLFRPVLETCARAIDEQAARLGRTAVKIAGISGLTDTACQQARLARELGYDLAIPSLAAFKGALPQDMIYHMRELAKIMPLFGFYLLTGVGGIHLPYRFWRELVDLENLVGIKIAPFNRYFTLDVCRAVAEAGREDDVVLYTGNDESIVHDLVTPFRFMVNGQPRTVRMRGGLLGQWGCWTRKAVALLAEIHGVVDGNLPISPDLLARAAQITDANAALFDPAHDYAGSIPGIHEVLRRQGLMTNNLTLKHDEVLAPGQLEEIDRVLAAYPHLQDDEFVAQHLHEWLA